MYVLRPAQQKNTIDLVTNLWHHLDCFNDWKREANKSFSYDTVFRVCHPFEKIHGFQRALACFFVPFFNSFANLTRDVHIHLKGEFKGNHWVSHTGYYSGKFIKDWLGVYPSHKQEFIRFGEFYQIETGKIVRVNIILDLLDFLYKVKTHRFNFELSSAIRFDEQPIPKPYTKQLEPRLYVSSLTHQSLHLVEDMIFKGLQSFNSNRKLLADMGMKTYWCNDLIWYGPGGIGTCYGLKDFQQFHQQPFLRAKSDRVGGNHMARIAFGLLVASSGWPSIYATQNDSWLGFDLLDKPKKPKITMRVMDWWLRKENYLWKNWGLIDIPNIIKQMGYSVDKLLGIHYCE